MKAFLVLAALPLPLVSAFSFNTWDLGFHGLYPSQHFQSTDLQPPAPQITQWDDRCDSGSLFFTPRGPLVTGKARGPVIMDPGGNLIWMDNDEFAQALNFDVQRYKGEDFLTFWTKGKKGTYKKHQKKSYVMLNSSYEVAHRIFPVGKGLKGDSHEFRITPQGTALITIYYKHEADCTNLSLGKKCWIQDGLFQEIDIETNELLFEWRATDHIRMTDVFSSPSMKDGHGKSKDDAFDFFHINSVDKTNEGNYIISARYMHAVVCISGKTGDILWQLGGKNNDFKGIGGALNFAWQHHVTWQGNNTLSLFDNHANSVLHAPSKHSKGMVIHLDLVNKTATLLGKYIHPDKILNVSQGSVQLIPETGNVLVGFGNSPTYIEYLSNGTVLCAAHFAPHLVFELIDFGFVKSYRVFKHPWVGRPKTVPDVKVKNGKAYVSWNGATEVTGWRLETAKASQGATKEFSAVQEASRTGFETTFVLDGMHKYLRIAALTGENDILAYSAVVKSSSPYTLSAFSIICIIFSTLTSLTILAFALTHRRLPHVPRHLPKLSDLPRLSDLRLSDLKAVWSPKTRPIEDRDEEEAGLLMLEEADDEDEGQYRRDYGRREVRESLERIIAMAE